MDAAAGDYRLLPWSSCLDAGYTKAGMGESLDLDGNSRLANGTVDIGAYESPFGRYWGQPLR